MDIITTMRRRCAFLMLVVSADAWQRSRIAQWQPRCRSEALHASDQEFRNFIGILKSRNFIGT